MLPGPTFLIDGMRPASAVTWRDPAAVEVVSTPVADSVSARPIELSPQRYETPRLVLVESPFAGDVASNVAYARACLADCLARGEAPFASHLLYTQHGVLCDDVPAERAQGIAAGLAWGDRADATVVYTDRGVSRGMLQGIARAEAAGRPVERRTVPGWADPADETHPCPDCGAATGDPACRDCTIERVWCAVDARAAIQAANERGAADQRARDIEAAARELVDAIGAYSTLDTDDASLCAAAFERGTSAAKRLHAILGGEPDPLRLALAELLDALDAEPGPLATQGTYRTRLAAAQRAGAVALGRVGT